VEKIRDGGHEQLISNGGRVKPAFAERDKKQTMIDLRGISTNLLKNQLRPSIRLSKLRALDINLVRGNVALSSPKLFLTSGKKNYYTSNGDLLRTVGHTTNGSTFTYITRVHSSKPGTAILPQNQHTNGNMYENEKQKENIGSLRLLYQNQ